MCLMRIVITVVFFSPILVQRTDSPIEQAVPTSIPPSTPLYRRWSISSSRFSGNRTGSIRITRESPSTKCRPGFRVFRPTAPTEATARTTNPASKAQTSPTRQIHDVIEETVAKLHRRCPMPASLTARPSTLRRSGRSSSAFRWQRWSTSSTASPQPADTRAE